MTGIPMRIGGSAVSSIEATRRAESKPESGAQKAFSKVAVLYVHMWIIEGALRKWVPGSENVFYIARDAMLLLALALIGAFAAGPRRSTVGFWVLLAGLTIYAACQGLALHLSLPVIVVGLRSYAAPAFLLYGAWRYRPVGLDIRLARVAALYALPEAALVTMQVLSSPSSIINRQASGEVASFINFGVVRASGTFSAPAGLCGYAPLALAACIGLLVAPQSARARLWTRLNLCAIIMILVLGGNRLAVFVSVWVVVFFLAHQVANASAKAIVRIATMSLSAAVVGVTLLAVFPGVIGSFTMRFERASASEDTPMRILDQTFGFLGYPATLAGSGIGVHSQAGISLGSGGPWVEWDATRWVAELGAVGILLAICRLLAAFVLLFVLLKTLRRRTALCACVAGALLPVVTSGQVTQFPSNQALFSVASSIVLMSWVSDRSGVPRQERFPS